MNNMFQFSVCHQDLTKHLGEILGAFLYKELQRQGQGGGYKTE
jgi:hypothetical protein